MTNKEAPMQDIAEKTIELLNSGIPASELIDRLVSFGLKRHAAEFLVNMAEKEKTPQDLINMLDELVARGVSKSEMVDKVISFGLERDAAKKLVRNTTKRPRKAILKFILFSGLISFSIFYCAYLFVGRESLIGLSWYFFGISMVSFLILIFLPKFSNKALACFRIFCSYLFGLFAVFLSYTLFLQSPWGNLSADIPVRGRRAGLLRALEALIEMIYFIGPMGWCVIMAIVALAGFLSTWSLYDDFIDGKYDMENLE